MRKLLLLAVSVSLVLATPVMARGNFQSYAENTSKYQQDYRTPEEVEEDQNYEDGTDWEDHTLPAPQYDSQRASLAMCGKHTVFINQDDNVLTVDGITYQLLGTDYRQTENDVALIDHYAINPAKSDKLISLLVFQKSRKILFYKNGESHSVECVKPQWN